MDGDDGAREVDGNDKESQAEDGGEDELLGAPDLQGTEFEQWKCHDRQVGEHVRNAAVDKDGVEEGQVRGGLAGLFMEQVLARSTRGQFARNDQPEGQHGKHQNTPPGSIAPRAHNKQHPVEKQE